jgi:antitoxin component of MazEF toxin-antitoxin module
VTLTIEVKIAKMGNSLRMTIPVPVAKALKFQDGDTVEVGIKDDAMIVRKMG